MIIGLLKKEVVDMKKTYSIFVEEQLMQDFKVSCLKSGQKFSEVIQDLMKDFVSQEKEAYK